jgi:hypothetical protein
METNTNTNETTGLESNGFARLLQLQREGDCQAEASVKLAELVERVRLVGKPGKLRLELTVTPANNSGDAVTVLDELTTKLPAMPRANSLFFLDDTGGLHRDNPKQMKLELKAVAGAETAPPAQLKQVVNG